MNYSFLFLNPGGSVALTDPLIVYTSVQLVSLAVLSDNQRWSLSLQLFRTGREGGGEGRKAPVVFLM